MKILLQLVFDSLHFSNQSFVSRAHSCSKIKAGIQNLIFLCTCFSVLVAIAAVISVSAWKMIVGLKGSCNGQGITKVGNKNKDSKYN